MRKIVFLAGLLLTAASWAQTHTLQLSWSESDSCYVESTLFDRSEPFAAEPQLSAGTILRGVLQTGYQDCKAELGLLWDVNARKLYVDLNADGDLTNDGDPLTSEDSIPEYQSFPAFVVSFTSDEGKRSFRLTPTLRNASWSKQAEFSVASVHTGDIELHGQTWHLKVWDSLKRPLTDSPYFAIAKQPAAGSLGYFATPQSVFLGDRCYDLALASGPQPDGRAGLTCTLTERDVPTGTIDVRGQWIRQLVLTGEDESSRRMLVIPQQTAGPVTVPAGTLKVETLILQPGDDKPAFGPIPWGDWKESLTVAEGQTAELAVGGPLKQSVSVQRSGSLLTFTYALTGAGGEPYDIRQLYNYDYNKKPSVTIYKGDMQLAKGSFEYG